MEIKTKSLSSKIDGDDSFFLVSRAMRVIPAFLVGLFANVPAHALDGGQELELKSRAVYWHNDEFLSNGSPSNNKSLQNALGMQLNYKSAYIADMVGFDASGYAVAGLGTSGPQKANLLEVDNNSQLRGSYATLGQAYVKIKKDDLFNVRIGRQLSNTLFLKSTATRAVPDTYSGVAAELVPLAGLSIYGAYFDQWRARSTGDFEKFRTERTTPGSPNSIDYLSVAGASYTHGPISANVEYLNAKNYLTKMGVVAAYTIPLDKNSLKLSGGVFTAHDAGSLFVCGAESEFDCSPAGARLSNDSTAYYLDADWKLGNLTLGGAIAKFNGVWIEDNFAVNSSKTGSLTSDHGTNPFPTSASLGPDLANNGERVWSVRVTYDWKDFVSGLKTAYKYAEGAGGKKSHIVDSTTSSEHYQEVNVDYALPFIKNLSIKYVYLDYQSSINGSGTIKGIPRTDWEQHRVYLDYAYRF